MPEARPPSPEPVPALERGDSTALVRMLYGELRTIAAAYFREQAPGHSLQPTILVHEAFLKLRGVESCRQLDRSHFLALAARAMRQVLVDHARARRAEKRGGRVPVLGPGPENAISPSTPIDVLELNEAMERLAALDARAAAVVELRFFAGLTIEQVAQTLGVSDWTVEAEWRLARSWLAKQLAIH